MIFGSGSTLRSVIGYANNAATATYSWNPQAVGAPLTGCTQGIGNDGTCHHVLCWHVNNQPSAQPSPRRTPPAKQRRRA